MIVQDTDEKPSSNKAQLNCNRVLIPCQPSIYERSGMEEDRVFTVKEAAEYLKMSPDYIRAQMRKGSLGCYRFGKSIRFSMEHIEDYLRSIEHKAVEK